MRKFYTLTVIALLSLQVYSQEIKEYCLENDAAHRYLTEVQYDPNDYSYTKITDYCDPKPYQYYKYDGYRKDQPLPVPVKFTNPLNISGILYVSESGNNNANAYTVTVAAGVDSVNVYNLIPGRTYNWKLVLDDGEMTEVESGVFKTTGTLRMLKVDNIFNVRDMGGWIGLGGHPLKYGKLIRGSRMNKNGQNSPMLTEAGKKALRQVGIRADLDLRNASDAANVTHSFIGDDIPIVNVEKAYGSRISTFSDKPQSIQGIQQIIKWLQDDKPVYFHCSVGADRTGTVAYLIGALCGMSEDELCKEFELTSFSADSIVTSGRQEDLRRRRTYDGRFDPNDDPASYQFATMVDKIKKFPGANLQRKVYYHLSTGAKASGGYLSYDNGTAAKISEADLDWLIKYMVDYVIVKDIKTEGGTTLTMEPGQTHELKAVVVPDSASEKTLSYASSDPLVATVSDGGVITALRGGTAKISVKADDYVKTITVNVPYVESYMPLSDTIRHEGKIFIQSKNKTNLIQNGSFEYAHSFLNWKGANEKDLTSVAFDLVKYDNNSDSLYILSKADGDSTSMKSLRTMWRIERGKSYVFGYKVKNSTNNQITEHTNLATSLLTLKTPNLDATGDDFTWDTVNAAPMRSGTRGAVVDSLTFAFPSYGAEWTDVQYIFTNTDGHQYIQVWFTHLSQGGNNTCLDNFYLCELTDVTGVGTVMSDRKSDGKIYNLAGQEVTNPGKGVYIKDGKKYIVK